MCAGDGGIRSRSRTAQGLLRPRPRLTQCRPRQGTGAAMTRHILPDQQQRYDLIKPLGEFKPMGPISHVEIQPVKEYDGYCEPWAYGEGDIRVRLFAHRTFKK